MSKFSNILKIITILKNQGLVKSNDLAEQMGTSTRMIRKYIKDIIDAGLKVESIPGPKGGYKIVDYNGLIDMQFTEEEQAAYITIKNTYMEMNTTEDNISEYIIEDSEALITLEYKINVLTNIDK